MTNQIPDAELTEMEARADEATQGPWEQVPPDGEMVMPVGVDDREVARCTPTKHHLARVPKANARFIAHVRTDLPRVVNAYREALKEVDRLTDSLKTTRLALVHFAAAGVPTPLVLSELGGSPMTQPTKIQWAERTWNPLTGCSKVSAGCEVCYAIPTAWKLAHNPNPKVAAAYAGTVKKIGAALQWTGKINLLEERLLEPLRLRKPSRIFVNSMADLFHPDVPDEFIDRVYAVMALCPQHQFMILTKRPERRREYLNGLHGEIRHARLESCWAAMDVRHPTVTVWPLPNVSEGTSVEDQATANERIPVLLDTPAAVRWVSFEPALEEVDFTRWLPLCFACMRRLEWRGPDWVCTNCGHTDQNVGGGFLDGIVMGGESGPGARPMHPSWPQAVRDQCAAAGVAYFFKQWGAWAPASQVAAPHEITHAMTAKGTVAEFTREALIAGDRETLHWEGLRCIGKKAAGRLLDGREHNDLPGAPQATAKTSQ